MPVATSRLIAAVLLFGLTAGAAAAPLAICYEDVVQRPWTTPDGGGLNLELLKRVEKRLGEKFVFTAKPWKRCMEEVRAGSMDAVVGAADSPERRRHYRVPTLPDGRADLAGALYQDAYMVFYRKGSGAGWDGRELVPAGGRVLVQHGYVISELLRARGYQPDELVKAPVDGLRMLANGGRDIAILHGREPLALVRDDPRFQGKVLQAALPYEVMGFYLLFGRTSHERQAARIEAIWRAIALERRSPSYQQLETEAGVGK